LGAYSIEFTLRNNAQKLLPVALHNNPKMMDFEDAAQRLARDQSKMRRGRKTVAVSEKAKREVEFRKKQQERMRQERLKKQKQLDYINACVTSCDRSLSVKQLVSASSTSSSLQLKPTSIHGDGDKIALPPSILEFLTQSMALGGDDGMTSSPWMFRVGILKPNYSFPESVLIKTLKPKDDGDDMMHDDSEDEDDDNHAKSTSSNEAYLDELAHKYIAYTHATVVEFTQEEGHVGLPSPIAAALLDPERRLPENASVSVPTMRTKDPSALSAAKENAADEGAMKIDHNLGEEEEKTPGHVAWGAFDVPDMPVEITMVQLPKGKGCTLTPTREAIQNGFFNLQNVKLVLEQSLIRTRATLSVGDVINTWHRGVKFDLHVSKVIPSKFNAVTCINTDIEVELGEVKDESSGSSTQASTNVAVTATTATGNSFTGGRTLSSPPSPVQQQAEPTTAMTAVDLLPEPPQNQKEGICTVQIRSDGVPPARRRFDVRVATLGDLFAFASSVAGVDTSEFRLVTRFPRKVYESEGNTGGDNATTMIEAGIQPGQELFMVERL